jgi:hypothetical protein
MKCPVCGRANAESVSGTVSRSGECLDCSDSDQRLTADYTESTATQALAAPAPTTDVSPTGESHRASGPNAWTRSLERIQLRCAVLAKEAARDRAARVAQRGRVASELATFEPPTLELTESKPPPSGRLNEVEKFDWLWDKLASDAPSSLTSTPSIEQLRERNVAGEPETACFPVTSSPRPEEPQEQSPQPLACTPSDQISKSEAMQPEPASDSTTSSIGPEGPQEPTSQPLDCTLLTDQINDSVQVTQLEAAPSPATSCQRSEEDLQEQTPRLDEPPTDPAASSLPSEASSSTWFRAMIGLLRTRVRTH